VREGWGDKAERTVRTPASKESSMSLHSPAGAGDHCRAHGTQAHKHTCNRGEGNKRTPQLLWNQLSTPPVGKQARRQSG
jgi:hypothetical protein